MGDSNIFGLYKELTGKPLTYQTLLQDNDILTNLYYHLIRDGASAMRIPSIHCHKIALQQENLADKAEQLINLFVSSAKNALKKTRADILNLGVVSYANIERTKNAWQEMEKNIAEKIILLSDFGVDAIFIEAVNHWEQMKKILLIIQEQCSQPLAPFFALKNFQNNQLQEYQELYQNMQLEMLGLEIEPLDMLFPNKEILAALIQKTHTGFLLKNFQSSAEKKLAINFFQKNRPTAIFGGVGVSRKWWNHFCQGYFG